MDSRIVVPSMVPMLENRAEVLENTVPAGTETPTSLGISPTITMRLSPNTKPVTMGLDRNSATHPMRSSPAATSTSPAPIASPTV